MKKLIWLIVVLLSIEMKAQKTVNPTTKPKTVTNPIGDGKLLWYRGKKNADNSLVTVKGITIKLISNKFIQVMFMEEKPHIKNISKRLKKKSQDKNLLVKKAIDKRGPAHYLATNKMVEQQELIDKIYSNIASTQVNLFEPITNPYEIAAPEEAPNFQSNVEAFRSGHKEIMEFARTVKTLSSSDIPDFPTIALPCNHCIENQKDSDDEKAKFFNELFGEEIKHIQKSILLQRSFYIMLKEPKELLPLVNDLQDANIAIIDRMLKKCDLLFDKNKQNIEALFSIVPMIVSIERQSQLLGAFADENGSGIINKVMDVITIEAVTKFMKQKVAERDLRYIINPAIFIGMVRQVMLFGGMEDNQYVEMIETILNQNRFQFDLTLEVKRLLNGRDEPALSIKSVMTGEPFYYYAVQTPDCRLLLVPQTGKQTVFSTGRLMNVNIKEAQHAECTYTGGKKFHLTTPIIHLDFCEDTARVEFSFSMMWPNQKETWSCKHGTNEDYFKNMLSDGFNNRADDTNAQMDELLNSGTDEALRDLTSGKDPVINSLEELNTAGPKAIAQFQKMFDFRQFIKRITIRNFSETVFDEALNGKETHDPDDERFEYAWLKIRLQHAPLLK